MNVLLLAENWPPRVGGIENYLLNIATHLPPGSVKVIAPTADASGQVTLPSITVQRRRFFWPLIRPAWLPLFISLYRQAKRYPHEITLCGKALFEGLCGYYLKKYLGIPYVVFTYAMEIETWGNTPRTRRALVRVLGNADRVVYINDQTKQALLELGVRQNQLVKIWPGISPQFLEAIDAIQIDNVKKKYQLAHPYILCVARLIPRKGIDLLLEAFAALDQTKYSSVNLVIVGQGPELAPLQKVVEQNYIARNVLFLTVVPAVDLPALYAGSLFFALTPRNLPGDSEGFGIVYLEAAALGKAAVGTTTGGVGEAVLHQQTGLLVPPEAKHITAALTQLLSNEALRQKLGAAGKDRVKREFDWRRRVVLVKGMLDSITL